jgi:quercetin dioxygenase-like cupin family protein
MIKTVIPKYQVTYDGTTLNVFHANVGEGLPKHEHDFPHLTFCHAGIAVIRKDGRELVMTKDTQPVNLAPNEWHELEALEDGTVFVNVFSEGTN